jgi:hypothetical protein
VAVFLVDDAAGFNQIGVLTLWWLRQRSIYGIDDALIRFVYLTIFSQLNATEKIVLLNTFMAGTAAAAGRIGK